MCGPGAEKYMSCMGRRLLLSFVRWKRGVAGSKRKIHRPKKVYEKVLLLLWVPDLGLLGTGCRFCKGGGRMPPFLCVTGACFHQQPCNQPGTLKRVPSGDW